MKENFKRDSSQKSFLHLCLQEALHGNRQLNQGLLFYALFLMVLGGQLPFYLYLVPLVLMTPFFVYYFKTYTKWNGSHEYRQTLPQNPLQQKKTDRMMIIISLLPFYFMSFLSLLKISMLTFFVTSIIFFSLYLVGYHWVSAKSLGAVRNSQPMFKMLRKFGIVGSLLIMAILAYGVYLFPKFSPQVKGELNNQLLVPKRFMEVKQAYEYKDKNWDKILIVATVSHLDGRIVYQGQKVLNRNKQNIFKLTLADFPDSPKNLHNIHIESNGSHISLNNLGRLSKKSPFDESKSDQRKIYFDSGATAACNIKSPVYEYAVRDPWYKRLFSVRKQSFNLFQTTSIRVLPYREGEEFVNVPTWDFLKKNLIRYSDTKIKYYFRKNLQSTYDFFDSLKYWETSREPEVGLNFTLPLAGLYFFYFALLLAFGFVCYFQIKKMIPFSFVLIAIICIVDAKLLQSRLQFIKNDEHSLSAREFAVAELHSTLVFRKIAQGELDKIMAKYREKINRDYTVADCNFYRTLRHAALNLWPKNLSHKIFSPESDLSYLFNKFSSRPSGGYYFLSINNRHDTFALNHDGFMENSIYPLKLIEKPGLYYISARDKTLFHFEGLSSKNLNRRSQSYKEINLALSSCVTFLKEDPSSVAGLKLLKENELIHISLLYHLFRDKRYNKKAAKKFFSTGMISLSRDQQRQFILENIRSVSLLKN